MWFETTYWLSQCMRKKIFVRRLADAKEGSNALCQRRTRTSSLQLDAFPVSVGFKELGEPLKNLHEFKCFIMRDVLLFSPLLDLYHMPAESYL